MDGDGDLRSGHVRGPEVGIGVGRETGAQLRSDGVVGDGLFAVGVAAGSAPKTSLAPSSSFLNSDSILRASWGSIIHAETHLRSLWSPDFSRVAVQQATDRRCVPSRIQNIDEQG